MQKNINSRGKNLDFFLKMQKTQKNKNRKKRKNTKNVLNNLGCSLKNM